MKKCEIYIACVVLIASMSNLSAQNENSISVIVLQASKVIEHDDDRFYMNRPEFINYDHDKDILYVVDSGNDNIFVLNNKFEYMATIGRFGQGPGEFEKLATVYGKGDKIITTDRNRVQLFYSNGVFDTGFRVHFRAPRFPICCCLDSNGKVYIPYPKNGKLISIYTSEGKLVNSFGELYSKNSPNGDSLKDIADNLVHLRIDTCNNIYVVFYNQTIIRKYNGKFKLVWETDLSNFKSIKQKKHEVKAEKQRVKNNSNISIYNSFFSTVCLDHENLYIHIQAGDFPVLALDLESGKITKKYLLQQENGINYFILHIESDGERFFTINQRNQILVTNMSEN